MASKNYFLNGVAELLILSILKNQNTIYAAAYKLENEEKISEYSKLVGRKRTRIYYHIEKPGLTYLEKLTSDYQMVTTNVCKILDFLSSNSEENTDE